MLFFRTMLPLMAERIPDMRVIVCKRKLIPAIRSHVNLALNLEPTSYKDRWFRCTRAWAAAWAVIKRAWWCRQIVHDPRYRVFSLPFERVLSKDAVLLDQLAHFLDTSSWEHLAKAIRPDVSEFSRA